MRNTFRMNAAFGFHQPTPCLSRWEREHYAQRFPIGINVKAHRISNSSYQLNRQEIENYPTITRGCFAGSG